jgi:hypothetical protein
LCCLVLIS